MAKYSVINGKFVCHTCKAEVTSLRWYAEEKEVTWMCIEKHLSSAKLHVKKSKKDYDRKK